MTSRQEPCRSRTTTRDLAAPRAGAPTSRRPALDTVVCQVLRALHGTGPRSASKPPRSRRSRAAMRAANPHLSHRLQIRSPRRAKDPERGTITAFVVVLSAAFVLLAGLVYDGGNALAAKTAVIDQAQQAARTAAAAIDPQSLRQGTLAVTPAQAVADAEAYLAACGDTGTVTITTGQITVHVTRRQPTVILGVIGIGQITVTGTATATLEQGVSTPDSPAGS
jgi:hypothetical protein